MLLVVVARLTWDQNAWDDYLWWQAQDGRVWRRINTLLADIVRNGNEGIGKPEALKHDFAGYWSRRITDEHRLMYKIAGNEVRIAAYRYHYFYPRSARSRISENTLCDYDSDYGDNVGFDRQGPFQRG